MARARQIPDSTWIMLDNPPSLVDFTTLGNFPTMSLSRQEADMYKVLMTLCVCTIAAALAGCNDKPDQASAGGTQADMGELAAQAHSTITDVPLPAGFELDASKSVYLGGATRLVKHVYKGNGDQGAIVRFFKRQMPAQRWSMTSIRQMPVGSKGQWILDFVKDNERCEVTVTGRTSLFHNTEIDVSIYADAKIEPAGSGSRR